MNLRSFLTILSAAASASSTASAIELTRSSFGLRNFLPDGHPHHDEMAPFLQDASNPNEEEIECNPTGNDPSQSDCPTDHEDANGRIIEYSCILPEGECPDPDPNVTQSGVCKRVRKACNRMWRPVCGCDGVSYPNSSCTRGVNIAHGGGCEDEE